MLSTNAVIMCTIAVLFILYGLITNRNRRVALTISETSGKTYRISFIIILLFFCIVGALITDTYDISSYRYAYDERLSHGKEPLFDSIQFFFHDIGWNFDSFKLLWIIIIAILLYKGIKRISNAPEEVVALA